MKTQNMDIETAREIIEAFIESDDPEGQFSTRHTAQALHALGDDGDEDDQDLVRRAFDTAPGLINYDGDGNWVGPVANENGWTA